MVIHSQELENFENLGIGKHEILGGFFVPGMHRVQWRRDMQGGLSFVPPCLLSYPLFTIFVPSLIYSLFIIFVRSFVFGLSLYHYRLSQTLSLLLFSLFHRLSHFLFPNFVFTFRPLNHHFFPIIIPHLGNHINNAFFTFSVDYMQLCPHLSITFHFFNVHRYGTILIHTASPRCCCCCCCFFRGRWGR